MEKFARKCDISGIGMNEGYCFNDYFYCATEELAKRYVENLGLNWGEECLTVDTEDEWFFWTQWSEDDIDGDWYDEEGNLYQEGVLNLIYIIYSGIPEDYFATKDDLKARKIYISKAEEAGVKFPEQTSHLGIDELSDIVREQLEFTEKEVRWESVTLI